MLSEQFTQTLNHPGPFKQIYQGMVKFIVNKHGDAKYLPLLKYQACTRSPTTKALYILNIHFNIDSIDTTFPFNNSLLHQDWHTNMFHTKNQLLTNSYGKSPHSTSWPCSNSRSHQHSHTHINVNTPSNLEY